MDQEQRGPLRFRVTPEQAGRTLAELVAQALGDAAQAAEVIARGGAWLGRERVQIGARRAEADTLVTVSRPPAGCYAEVVFDPAWIIYEDADLLAIDKPVGLYVEMTPWDVAGNLRAALERFLAEREGAGPPHLAHRLDRDTSGVLLFSKNPRANAPLQRAFAEGAARKQYLALCAGQPPEDTFTLATGHGRGALGQFRAYPLEQVGQALADGSVVKPMRTRFAVLRRLDGAALVEALPETGRTHQIRLHMAYLGTPLIGDTRYGGPASWRGAPVAHHHLHAARLSLPHPLSHATLELVAPAPGWVRDADAADSLAAEGEAA